MIEAVRLGLFVYLLHVSKTALDAIAAVLELEREAVDAKALPDQLVRIELERIHGDGQQHVNLRHHRRLASMPAPHG